jgi:hypothetical protein
MIVFIHEDRAYLSWLARHRQGFVVDWLQKPTKKQPVLHRATCPEIKRSRSKSTHWTTGRHIKACGMDVDELRDWVCSESDRTLLACPQCQPQQSQAPEGLAAAGDGHEHLTSLGKEILDYVLEVSVMCLDGAVSGYAVSLADVAQCLSKTPAQLTAATLRLVDDQYLALPDQSTVDAALLAETRLFPTAKALRSLPAFQPLTDRQIEAELKRLAP